MPSLRSSVFRLFTRYYLRSGFSVNRTVEQHRKFLLRVSKLSLLPFGTKVQQLSIDGVSAEWVSGRKAQENRVVLYLHGGAYTFGSTVTHRDIAARISNASGARVLNLDYRLAPEHPHPAAVEDATNAFRWLLKQEISPKNIAIAGDSAGGGLTLATMIALRDAGDPLPAAAACIAPWTDLENTGESVKTKANVDPLLSPDWATYMANFYVNGQDPHAPTISPLYANLKGLPPIIIQVGSDEILVSDAVRFTDRAREEGVEVRLDEWDRMWHVWHFFGGKMPEADKAIVEIGEFLKTHFG